MTLWLLRHALPLVAPGTCYGQLDIPADEYATLACARQLVKNISPTIRIFSSPLQRCEQLAQALIGLEPDLSIKTDARLQEMDFGQWENRAWASIPEAELADWTQSFASYPAGATGETVTGFLARVASAFDDFAAGGADTLWITHAGVIRAAGLIASGTRCISRADQWPAGAPAYGRWCKLQHPPV